MNEQDKLLFWKTFALNFMYEGCEQRPGQAMMNALRQFPDLYDKVHNSRIDPWDDQTRIPAFREFVGV